MFQKEKLVMCLQVEGLLSSFAGNEMPGLDSKIKSSVYL